MMLNGGQLLHAYLNFFYLLLIGTSGIEYRFYIGVVVSAMILLIIAVVVTCLVTWRHGTGSALVIVRQGRGNFSDHQVAACAKATVHQPHRRARSSSAQQPIRTRTKKEKERIQRSLALGYRKSKSLTNLAASFDATDPFIGIGQQVNRDKQSMSASCSALDLPLPPKPMQMSVLYEDQENRKSEFLNVQNVAYTTNDQLASRPPCPPPYSETPTQSHVYEQLDQVQSTAL